MPSLSIGLAPFSIFIFLLSISVSNARSDINHETVFHDQFKPFRISELENWLILEKSKKNLDASNEQGIYIFKNSNQGAQQIYYYPLIEPRYFKQYGYLSFIEGVVDKDLCRYCPEDKRIEIGNRYKIPIRIHLPSFRIEVMVDEATKRKVLTLLKERVTDLKRQYSSEPEHLSYLLASQRQLTNLLVTYPAFEDVNID